MVLKGLLRGLLVKRYKRFFADIALDDGTVVIAHCPNTGSMKTLLGEGVYAYILPNNDPKRKLKYTLCLLELPNGALACVNTQYPNHIVREAIESKHIPELQNFDTVRAEVKYGAENSRIDLLLEQGDCKTYVEVKNVTYLHQDDGDMARFPDSVTSRGLKHLHELEREIEQGNRAVMLYLVSRTDARSFSIAGDIDPKYAAGVKRALEKGVEILPYTLSISLENDNWILLVDTLIPFKLT